MSTRHVTRAWLGLAWLSFLSASLAAHEDALPTWELDWQADTGLVRNEGDRPQVVASFSVHVAGASWLRLFFSDVVLSGSASRGTAAFIRVTSHRDGAVQELDALHLAQWSHSSAYFNGDAVQVDLFAHPGTGESRVSVTRVSAGAPLPETICGATDDRVPSSDPRVARIMPSFCTAFLIDDCQHCMVSAGHCADGAGAQVAEFNVPFSDSAGNPQHPGPQDQYAVDAVSLAFSNNGLGNDWAYFGTFANSTTGMEAFARQGGYFILDIPPLTGSGEIIRVTGHGGDSVPPEHNRVQQTAVGPHVSTVGNLVRYLTDVTGGNSGSPLIAESTGRAVGVATHASCPTGPNFGTSSNRPSFAVARRNPQGVCAPASSPGTYCTGKTNSLGCVPFITTSGLPSATHPEPFRIDGNDMLPNGFGILLYSFAASNLDFHGGKLCVKSPFVRTAGKNPTNPGGPPCTGRLRRDFNQVIQSGIDPMLTLGQHVHAQWRQRDSADPAGFGDSLTNAVEFFICP